MRSARASTLQTLAVHARDLHRLAEDEIASGRRYQGIQVRHAARRLDELVQELERMGSEGDEKAPPTGADGA